MASGAVRELITKVKFTIDKASLSQANKAAQDIKSKLNEIAQKATKVTITANSTQAVGTLARIKGQLQALQGRVTTAYVEVKQKGKAIGEGVKKTGQALADNGGTIAATGAAMMAPLALPIKEAMDFESAMADVRKVVDFDTPQQFKEMAQDIAELSTRLPMTKEQIASIVAAGGQSNIAKDQLLSFAEAAGKMGIAFDISAEESGEAMAQIKTMFGMSMPEVINLADAMNYLGNESSAASPKILAVVKRVGAMGKIAGFSDTEVAALGAAITGIGVAPEVAATGIQNMSKALTGGYAITKDAVGAYARIGRTFDDVQKSMQVDAKGTLLDVLKRISKIDKAEQIDVMTAIFKGESLESVAPLLNNIGMLERSFDLVADKSKYAGSMEQEFAARNATTANSVQLLKNELSKLMGEIGDAFLPMIKNMAKGVQGFTKQFSNFSKEHPNLVSGMLAGVAAVGALLVALGGLGLAISGISTAFGALAPIFTAVGSVLSVGLAPILAILGAIASVIYFVGENWETVVSWFQPGIDSMKEGIAQLQSAWENLQPFIAAITPLLQAIATVIGGAIVGAVSLLWRMFTAAFNAIAGLINWVAGLLGGLGETIQWLAGGLSGLIDKAAQFIGMRGAINGTNEAMIQGWMNRGGGGTNNTQNISVGTINVPTAADVGKGVGSLAEVSPWG